MPGTSTNPAPNAEDNDDFVSSFDDIINAQIEPAEFDVQGQKNSQTEREQPASQTAGQGSGQSGSGAQPGTTALAGVTGTQPGTQGNNQGAQPGTQQGAANAQAERKPYRALVADEQGNIIDPQTNRILFNAGSERRTLEQLRKTSQETETKLVRTTAELEGLQRVVNGMSSAELVPVVEFAKSLKSNPVVAVQNLLTFLQKNNIDLSSLNLGSANVTAAVRDVVTDAIKPLTQQQQQAQQQEEARVEGVRKAEKFLEAYPDAAIHAKVIGRMVAVDGIDYVTAYWKLRSLVQNEGYDWNQDLVQQSSARAVQNGQRQPAPQNEQPSNLPNGRAIAQPAAVGTQSNPRRYNGNDDDFSEEIRESLTGITFQ